MWPAVSSAKAFVELASRAALKLRGRERYSAIPTVGAAGHSARKASRNDFWPLAPVTGFYELPRHSAIASEPSENAQRLVEHLGFDCTATRRSYYAHAHSQGLIAKHAGKWPLPVQHSPQPRRPVPASSDNAHRQHPDSAHGSNTLWRLECFSDDPDSKLRRHNRPASYEDRVPAPL